MKLFFKNYFHILSIASAVLLIHFYNNAFTTYGYFRDELYYIICSEHLGLGYVDQPPLCALILAVSRMLFGDSIFALRLSPSLAHAATVFLAGVLSKKIGGEKFAQILASICVGLAPGLMGMFGIYTMNAFDILLWAVVFYLIIRLNETQQPKYWIWIGIVIGLGLMNKISMGWLAAGLAVGTIATPMRKWMKTPYPWVAAGISFILFLPYIIWNIQHDLAHIEFARNAAGEKYASQNQITFLLGMIPHFNPLALPIWLAGFWMLFRQEEKEMRVLGFAVLTVLVILLVNVHSKTEYFNPAIVILFASGSVYVERLLIAPWRKIVGYVYCSMVTLFGFVSLPFAIDILPVNTFVSYAQALGEKPSSSEGKRMGALPQHFADRFGWEELTAAVASVYDTLSSEEKQRCVIFGQNYGEASAINFFGKKYGLPHGISGHNSYWLWGYGQDSVNVVFIIGGNKKDHHRVFDRVDKVAHHVHPYAMLYESDLVIYLCRDLKVPLSSVWQGTKHYD